MSKRVPELGQTGAEIVGAAAQIDIHRGFLSMATSWRVGYGKWFRG
jgi:hypothetical protein